MKGGLSGLAPMKRSLAFVGRVEAANSAGKKHRGVGFQLFICSQWMSRKKAFDFINLIRENKLGKN